MIDDKILMVKLFSGSFISGGMGNGREQFNINEKAIIDDKYYGIILSAGEWHDVSLYIVAIAQNTVVHRKMQTDENIIKNRIHVFKDGSREKVGYHTITKVEDMRILTGNYIPINIPKECAYAFRAQRFLSKEEKYRELREHIIKKTFDYINDTEVDLQPEQIDDVEPINSRDSSNEQLATFTSYNGTQINKKPWVSKNALIKAKYLCEFNSEHKTFITDKGHSFMEGHHLIRCTVEISEKFMEKYKKNIDTESNIVSLCPNCHRRIHYGSKKEKSEIIEYLYKIKRDELYKNGITITLNELKELYGIY